MSGLLNGEFECSLCGQTAQCFDLQVAICSEADDRNRQYGCVECLRDGRFQFWHDTDIGLLDPDGLTKVYNHNQPPPPGFPDEALIALRRTPRIATIQQELWLTHCNDFMVYQGTWEPADFAKNSIDRDGKKLFLQMTDHYPNLWEDSVREGETEPTSWCATYYVFKCRHCGALKGNWDCD